ncbi:lipoma-preferred partner homolog isoform X2 [Polyodon spathula]|uniref:lipoma-preferred partner homolog isoform X2 n=1 Tax=Polyodon spathula TaxID=7913 RepID=UPI001B7D9BD4|nr:lipoma-preferred partner homolog isoform X2 [Polyodon spathula]
MNYGGTLSNTSTLSTPVTGHKRMVIPTQPPLTATKKSVAKPQPVAATPAAPAAGIAVPKPQSMPQPVPASYTTASTPTRPTFNVQVKSAQPSPHYMPQGPQGLSPAYNQQYPQQPSRSPGPVQYMPTQPRSPDFVYGPPQPSRQPPARAYYEPQYPGGAGQGTAYGAQNTWRPELSYPTSATAGPGYQPPGPRKTYITDLSPAMMPAHMSQYGASQAMQQKGSSVPPMPSGPVPSYAAARPEDELERLTKKMLYDMEHPPSEEYFGRCSRCSENVVGEGSGCTAMDQVFHVECFTCVTCSRKLRGQPFYALEKKAYCEPCYTNTLEQCNICKTPIMERILRATGKAYHPHCFTCVECHRSLDGIPFTVDAGNHIHCIEDFHKKFAPRCSVCKEPIMPATGQEETVRIVALDRDFHVQCYRCEDCGSLLSEGDNQGCYPLDGHILCKTCNTKRIQTLTAKASTDL